jgi:hypothetical protein
MTVSVDISTGDHDAEARIFGKVVEVMRHDGDDDKNAAVLLVLPNEPIATPPNDTALLALLADIRKAAGDSHGRLMQDELVARIAGMGLNDARYRWLRVNYDVTALRQGFNDLIRVRPPQKALPTTGETFDGCIDAYRAALAATKPQGSAEENS